MHNLKDLRKNLETFKKKFKDRNLDFNTDEFNKADKANRELINKKELLEQKKNNYLNQKKNQILKDQRKFQAKLIKLYQNKKRLKKK